MGSLTETGDHDDSMCVPTESDGIKDMKGCIKMDFEMFREKFSKITVCWYDAYERVMDLDPRIPKYGYRISTTKDTKDRSAVAVVLYEEMDRRKSSDYIY